MEIWFPGEAASNDSVVIEKRRCLGLSDATSSAPLEMRPTLLARVRASSKRPLFSVDVSMCPDVWMSVRVFKMLLLQEFLSD